MLAFFKKLGSGFIGAIAGTISFPFAISYHLAKPFFDVANDPKNSPAKRFFSGCLMVFSGVIGLIGGTLFGATGGAFIGTALGGYYGYNKGIVTGSSFLFSNAFGNLFYSFLGSNTRRTVDSPSVSSTTSASRAATTSATSAPAKAILPEHKSQPKTPRTQPGTLPPGSSLHFRPAGVPVTDAHVTQDAQPQLKRSKTL